MKWRAIGHSSTGTRHLESGTGCQDSIVFSVVLDPSEREVLLVCASDGAGSAKFAAMAAEFTTGKVIEALTFIAVSGRKITESDIYRIMEDVYEDIVVVADLQATELNEYSCTVLGALVAPEWSAFFQLGDGAIITGDGHYFFRPLWWPQQGEYLNSTHFLIDDPQMSDLKTIVTDQPGTEIAIITDGLQMLALNNESRTAHQPFFTDLFGQLRRASGKEQIDLLQANLVSYLDSKRINARTDDDKTLFLATTMSA